jgi:hypothetical protein
MVSGRKSKSPIQNLFRGILSVVVLSSFILLIAAIVSGLWNTDINKFSKNIGQIFNRLNIPIDQSRVESVAGDFVERISQTDLGSGVSTYRGLAQETTSVVDTNAAKEASVTGTRIAILSDIHEDYDNLSKALTRIGEDTITTVILLGDLTNVGDLASLNKAKKVLDDSGLDYYVLPGDHDIATSLDDSNFISVFGMSSQVIEINGVSLLLFDNSPNFSPLPSEKLSWFKDKLPSASFVFLSQPLYTEGLNEPFSLMYMGSTKTPVSDPILQQKQELVLAQGGKILDLIRTSHNVKAVIAGDHHKSTNLQDKVAPNLKHYFVGAVTSTVNDLPQAAIQTSRYSVLTLIDRDSFKIDDVQL